MPPIPTYHGPSRNLYEVLHLSKSATQSEIRAAYYRLAKLSHPDKNPEADPTVFHELQQAYEILSDAEKRAQYDAVGTQDQQMRSSRSNFDPFSAANTFNDFFQSVFQDRPFASHTGFCHPFGPLPSPFLFGTSRLRQHGSGSHQMKSPDLRMEFDCTLEDLMNGKSVTIEVDSRVECSRCKGVGYSANARPRDCPQCYGEGYTHITHATSGSFSMRTSLCLSCQGSGEKMSPRHRCSSCRGSGLQTEKKKLDWKIPKGTLPGETICLPGAGHTEPGCRPGDLLLLLKLAPHPTFQPMRPRSRDLLLPLSITLSESLLGLDRLMFHHLDGQAVRLHLPSPHEPGYSIIKPGEMRVIRGSGLPGRPDEPDELNGDLWIKFEIEWPTAAWVATQDLDFLRQALPLARPDLGPSLPANSSQVYLTLQR